MCVKELYLLTTKYFLSLLLIGVILIAFSCSTLPAMSDIGSYLNMTKYWTVLSLFKQSDNGMSFVEQVVLGITLTLSPEVRYGICVPQNSTHVMCSFLQRHNPTLTHT